MPSPFPGMDPYLEHSALWPGVHQRLISYLGDRLNTLLPPHYVADIGERLYLVQPERSLYPDVVFEPPPTAFLPEQQQGSNAAVVTSDPPWVLTVEPVEVREVFIEILLVGDASRVVTVIEVPSPRNKTANSEGRQLYVTKQQEILQSSTHLIEIELLRYGEHTVAAPRGSLIARGGWDYLVCLHRGGQRGRYEVWAMTLRQRLPRIRVTLADGEPDIVLDVQTVFDRCYDEGAYARRLDYRREPLLPLSETDRPWAATLLHERRRQQ
jgi:Protein of unknown function (DUF4058)